MCLCQVPRALVNLVEPLHVTPLRELHMDPSLKCPTWLIKWEPNYFCITWYLMQCCSNNHKQFSFVSLICPCVILPKANSKALQKLEELNRQFQVGKIGIFTVNSRVHSQALTSLFSYSVCCMSLWSPAGMTLEKTSPWSSSPSSKKSLYPGCQSVTKLIFHLLPRFPNSLFFQTADSKEYHRFITHGDQSQITI